MAQNKKPGNVRLLRVKVITIGDRQAGKTALIKKLMGGDIQVKDENKDLQPGIAVVSWKLPWQMADGSQQTVEIHAWDFGEREFLYQTYRFFFNPRALYILVWEPRAGVPSDLEYWLYTIKKLSPGSPVLVVMNKADLSIQFIDKKKLKDKYDNIEDFFQVSCVSGSGVQYLLDGIRTAMNRIPQSVNEQRPGTREQIQLRLEKENKPYITYNYFTGICHDYGLTPEETTELGDYLHDVGHILLFHRDPSLTHFIILDYAWLNRAVYDLMAVNEIRDNKGVFYFNDLSRYWNSLEYPPEIHLHLVNLMEKFGLCYQVEGGGYLVPHLLPGELPSIDFDINKRTQTLEWETHYEYLPATIMNRLIARAFPLIKDKRYWKEGMELKYEGSTALVRKDSINKKITAAVRGNEKNELLSIIKNHLRQINAAESLEKDKDFKEKVPCNCSQCAGSVVPHLYDYEVLNHFKDKDLVFIPCEKSAEDVEIFKLLKGISAFPTTKSLLFNKPLNSREEVILGGTVPKHFSSLSIKKYKVLENLDIPQLNKINIFAGINNSGKSSLLEAIYLLANLDNIYAFFESLKIRGKFDAGMEATWVDEQARDPIEIRGNFADRQAAVKFSRQVESVESSETLDRTSYLSAISIDAAYGEARFNSRTRLFRDAAPKPLTGSFRPLCNNVLSNPYAIHDRREEDDFYKKSVESKTIDRITTFLKEHVDNGVEWVRNPGGGFKVSHIGFPTAKDLALFGEGMQRIFHIALRFATARDGVLLIDEMENAVHFQLLADFARLIRELAKEFNTQVFITSHSKECIDAFFKDKSESKDLTVYKLLREDQKIQCKFIGGERFAGLIDFMDIDVRGDI